VKTKFEPPILSEQPGDKLPGAGPYWKPWMWAVYYLITPKLKCDI
jgi:hypothetical protein